MYTDKLNKETEGKWYNWHFGRLTVTSLTWPLKSTRAQFDLLHKRLHGTEYFLKSFSIKSSIDKTLKKQLFSVILNIRERRKKDVVCEVASVEAGFVSGYVCMCVYLSDITSHSFTPTLHLGLALVTSNGARDALLTSFLCP